MPKSITNWYKRLLLLKFISTLLVSNWYFKGKINLEENQKEITTGDSAYCVATLTSWRSQIRVLLRPFYLK